MSHILGGAKGHLWRALLNAARGPAALGALAAAALLAQTPIVEAAPPPQSYCMPQLMHLSAEWNAIGFGIPQKPSQQIVRSRAGLIASGPEVLFMGQEIRQAFWDCEHGYVAAAQARAALVADKLSELW